MDNQYRETHTKNKEILQQKTNKRKNFKQDEKQNKQKTLNKKKTKQIENRNKT